VAGYFFEMGGNYAEQNFWGRGYFMDSVEKNTEMVRRLSGDMSKSEKLQINEWISWNFDKDTIH
jgi:REP element-mobilizing transposase RayT